MHTEKHIRLFRNGRNQALRIPKEFELEGNEATIRQDKGRLIIEPIRKGRLIDLLSSMEPIADVFPDIDKDLTTLDEVEI